MIAGIGEIWGTLTPPEGEIVAHRGLQEAKFFIQIPEGAFLQSQRHNEPRLTAMTGAGAKEGAVKRRAPL